MRNPDRTIGVSLITGNGKSAYIKDSSNDLIILEMLDMLGYVKLMGFMTIVVPFVVYVILLHFQLANPAALLAVYIVSMVVGKTMLVRVDSYPPMIYVRVPIIWPLIAAVQAFRLRIYYRRYGDRR